MKCVLLSAALSELLHVLSISCLQLCATWLKMRHLTVVGAMQQVLRSYTSKMISCTCESGWSVAMFVFLFLCNSEPNRRWFESTQELKRTVQPSSWLGSPILQNPAFRCVLLGGSACDGHTHLDIDSRNMVLLAYNRMRSLCPQNLKGSVRSCAGE